MVGQAPSMPLSPAMEADCLADAEGPRNASEGQTGRVHEILDAVVKWRRFHHRDAQPRSARRPFDPAKVAQFLLLLENGGHAWHRQGTLLNIWQVAGLGRKESRNTRVLAWVLDCKGSHGLRGLILSQLLIMLAARPGGDKLTELVPAANYFVHAEYHGFGDYSDRPDIALILDKAFLLIEAKIDAPEGSRQLCRYHRLAEAKAKALGLDQKYILYLTKGHSTAPEGVIHLTWRDIAAAIRNALRKHPARHALGSRLILQFADHCAKLR